MFRLDGKVALISGASRGLGWGMAKSLAQQGATVCLNGRDRKTLIARSNELKEQGFQAEVVPFDVFDTDEREKAIDALLKKLGKIDVLIANAGIQHRSTIESFSESDFRRVIETNLGGVWALAKSVAPGMKSRQRILFFTIRWSVQRCWHYLRELKRSISEKDVAEIQRRKNSSIAL